MDGWIGNVIKSSVCRYLCVVKPPDSRFARFTARCSYFNDPPDFPVEFKVRLLWPYCADGQTFVVAVKRNLLE